MKMRNTSAFHWTPLVALLASPVVASAQHTTSLYTPVISADGAWVAAEERSDRGAGNVRVWSTQRDVTFTIERGQNPRISRDSRWVSALQRPPNEDSGTAGPTNEREGQTLVLLDTQDGSRRTFDFVLSYDVTYSSRWLIYMQSPEMEADEEEPSNTKAIKPAVKPAAKERKVGTLHMVYLNGDRVFTRENVAEHASHQTSDHFAYVLHDETTGRDTLHVANFGRAVGWGVRAWYDGEKIEGLFWAHDPITLGFLDSTVTTGPDGKRRVHSALYTWEPAQSPVESDHQAREAQVAAEFTRVRGDSEFRALHNPVISADGAWVAAEDRSYGGDGNVRVWSTQRDLTFTIERGQNPRISRDSRWVSALQKPPLEDSKPKNKREGQTLVLLDTQDNSRRTFDFVLSYDMTYASTYLLYLQSPETQADKDEAKQPATKERKAGTLHQVPLNPARLSRIMRPYQPDQRFTKENVVEFVAHPTNDHFAYVFHDEETGGDTVNIIKWGIRAWYKGNNIEGLCWAGGAGGGDESITLGFFDSSETTGKDGKRHMNSAIYTWQPAQSSFGKFTQVDEPQ